ncbi:MAG: FAD-dependent monooxygenase [Candidatus Sericytochromatia bacterium]|nr:FAD-dependent monooxygenase [Candidatus Sericytochromatia bacterium]
MLQVVIVGGGPAGLIAAETLARARVATIVIESHPNRLLPCAGLATPAVKQALEAPDLLLAQRITEVAVFSPTQRVAFAAFGGPDRVAGIMRRDLLHVLLRRRAEEAGVVFKHAAFRRFLHGDGDYPLLEISPLGGGPRERLAADVVIAADGVHSRVARALGLPPMELGLAYMEQLSAPGGLVRQPESLLVHLGRKVAPERFGWLMPAEDRWLLGVTTHAKRGRRVKDLANRLRNRLGRHLDGTSVVGRSAFYFPWSRRQRLVHDRVMFIGDAAGLNDGTTLDGLYFAAVSGRLAAEVVAEHQHMPTPDRLAEYQERFEAAYTPYMKAIQAFEQTFFSHDKRREALVDLAWERDLQRLVLDTYYDKRPAPMPMTLRLKAGTRLAASLLRQAVVNPKREQETLTRALPAGGNYLDYALAQRHQTGPLPSEPPATEQQRPHEQA